jgi:hypothetical protein
LYRKVYPGIMYVIKLRSGVNVMPKYTERLEIRLERRQLQRLKKEAEEKKVPVGELVREAIDQKYAVTREERIEEAKKLCSLSLPVKEWAEMKKEIEAGSTE